MGRYFLTFILISLFFTVEARKITLEGNVTDADEREIRFSFINNLLTGERAVYRVTLREDNGFALGIDIGNSSLVEVMYKEAVYEIFISPRNHKINISFHAGNMAQSIQFDNQDGFSNNFLKSFRTNCRLHNTDMEKYESGGLITYIQKDLADKAKSYGDYDYFRKIEEDFNYQRRYLHGQPNLDPALVNYLGKLINWRYEVNKIAYFLLNKDRLSANDIRGFWSRYGVMRNADINDDNSLIFPEYQNLLSAFLHYLALESPGNPKDMDLAYYRFIEGNLTSRSRYFMQAKLMLENYQRLSNPRLAHRKFKGFEKETPYPEYAASLKSIFGGKLEFVPKTVVPDFQFIDLNQQFKNLSAYRGKVVYISLWASWCAPCLKNFQESYHIRKELERQGVVFLNVNIDKEESLWHNALSRNDIAGTNVYAIDMSELQAKMKISTLPHYILVNKSGKQAFLSSKDLDFSKDEFYTFLRE